MGDIAQCIQITDKLLRCNTPETNLVININIRVTLVTSLHPEPGIILRTGRRVLRLLSFRCGTAASFITGRIGIKYQIQLAVFINFGLAPTFDIIRITTTSTYPV